MMITISTTSEDEARDLAGVLSGALPGGLPSDRDYQVLLNGREYVPADVMRRKERRDRMRELIREAGPAGAAVRVLARQLYREDRNIASSTLYRWIHEDQEAGLIRPVRDGWAWCGHTEVT